MLDGAGASSALRASRRVGDGNMLGRRRRFRRTRNFLRAIAPAILGILLVWLVAKLVWGMLTTLAGC
jgi:hypothetical protein